LEKAAARVLLVFGSEPSGHAAAAFALEAAARAEGLDAVRVEIASGHHPAAGAAVARAYHGLLRTAPRAWGALYRSGAARALLRAVRASYLDLGGARRLRAGVRARRADVVVCPQASVAAVLSEARRRGDLEVPLVSVLTDFDPHPFWADPPADLTVVPDEAAARSLEARGVPPARLRALGVPVHPAFAAAPGRAAARRRFGLGADEGVVLLSGGSRGLGGLAEAAEAVLDRAPRARVLVLCGRDDRLRRRLAARPEAARRLRALGPQSPETVAALLAACDVHAGKPGGLSAAESLAVGVPLVLLTPFPGQEEANARRLTASGAALTGGGAEDAARLCAALLADPARRGTLADAARNAGRPGAAAAAVRAAAEAAGLLRAGVP
jgi:processive 1,2-diacylglycerol beta-glucosyltransferase